MKKIGFIALVAVICFLSSCKDDSYYYQVFFNGTEFKQQRALWKEQNLQNYTYTYDYFSSSGPFEMNVVVENGISSGDSEYSQSFTIDEVYDKIELDYANAVNRNINNVKNIDKVTIEVTYNQEYNYPEFIKYSTSYEGSQPAGGAYYEIRIKNFVNND